jgi:hypothetical protein
MCVTDNDYVHLVRKYRPIYRQKFLTQTLFADPASARATEAFLGESETSTGEVLGFKGAMIVVANMDRLSEDGLSWKDSEILAICGLLSPEDMAGRGLILIRAKYFRDQSVAARQILKTILAHEWIEVMHSLAFPNKKANKTILSGGTLAWLAYRLRQPAIWQHLPFENEAIRLAMLELLVSVESLDTLSRKEFGMTFEEFRQAVRQQGDAGPNDNRMIKMITKFSTRRYVPESLVWERLIQLIFGED